MAEYLVEPCAPSTAAGALSGMQPGTMLVANYQPGHDPERLHAMLLRILQESGTQQRVQLSIMARTSQHMVYCTVLAPLTSLETASLSAGIARSGAKSVAVSQDTTYVRETLLI